MTEQTSRLAIVIDSTGAEKQADSLSTALDKMTGSGKEATKAVSDTGKAADSAAKSVTRKARATEDESNALNALLAKIRPTNTALAELDKLSGRLTTAFNKGFINESQFVTYDTILAGLVMKMEKVDDELTGVAAAQREVAKTEKEAAAQAEAQSRALSQLEARLAPVTAALKGLDDQQRQVAEFAKSGAISADQYSAYIAKITEARREVTGEAQAERDAAKAAQEHAAAVSKLGSSLDPVTASLKRLDEQQKQVNANLKSGDISASQYDTYTQAISRARAEVNGEAQAERDAAKARQEHIASLSKLESSLDPVTAALKRLDDQQRQVNANFKAGDLTSAQYDTYNRSISTARAELNGEAQAARDSAKAHDEQKASLQRLVAQIDPASEALKRLDAQQQQLAQAKAKGLLDAETYDSLSMRLVTMRDEMDKARVQMDRGAISAGQYKQAMRQLPAQFTDIFTSIAGGMPLWLIFTQQGGQIADSFGGWSSLLDVIKREVLGFSDATEESSDSLSDNANGLAENADHLKQFSGLLTPTRLALGGVAAAVGLLTYAYYQGSKEQDAFNESLILTGNIVAKTSGQLADMSRTVADSAGSTVSAAAVVLNQLVAGGKVAAGSLASASEAILKLNDATGISTAQLVSDFEAIGQNPVEAIKKLTDQYHFLDLATYNQIRALQEQGNQQEAARIASDAYSASIGQKADDIKASLGTLQTAWSAVGDAAKGAWDSMLDIGRETSVEEKINLATAKLKAARSDFARGQAQGELNSLMMQKQMQDDVNGARAIGAKANERAIKAQEYINTLTQQTLTNAQKRTKEQEKLTKAIKDGAQISKAEEEKLRKNINDKYKDPKTPKGKAYTEDAATRLLDQLNQQNIAMQYQLGISDKMSSATQQRVKFEQQIADLKGKSQLTADQKSLLSRSEEILQAYKAQEAISDQVKTLDDYRKMQEAVVTKDERTNDLLKERLDLLEKAKAAGKLQPGEYEKTRANIYQNTTTPLPSSVQNVVGSMQPSGGQLSGTFGGMQQQFGQLDKAQQDLDAWLAAKEAAYAKAALITAEGEAAMNKARSDAAIASQAIETQKDAIITAATQSMIDSGLSILKDGFGEQSGIYKAAFAVSKAFAIAQSLVSIQQGIAMAAANPFPLNLAAMASVAAATASIISNISSVAGVGFMSGGYTGNMATNAVAGVVHGKEFVFDAAATKKIGVSNLEALRNGKPLDATLGKSGFGTGAQNVSNSATNSIKQNNNITQHYNMQGVTPDQLSAALSQSNKQMAKQLETKLASEIVTPQGQFGNALKNQYGRVAPR